MPPALDSSSLAVLIAAISCLAAAAGLGIWYWRRRLAGTIPARLKKASAGLLHGVLVPNADAGNIHLEYVALTPEGILVIDIKDVAGHVFGSEFMQEWTVLGSARRFTFSNPLPALYDRVAAVRRPLPEEVPVRGVVAFPVGAEFTKGTPPNVILFDQLIAQIGAMQVTADTPGQAKLTEAWQVFQRAVVPGESGTRKR